MTTWGDWLNAAWRVFEAVLPFGLVGWASWDMGRNYERRHADTSG